MIFVSATIVLVLLVALVLPAVLCGKKSETATVVSSAKKTDTNGIEKEEVSEEQDDTDEPST